MIPDWIQVASLWDSECDLKGSFLTVTIRLSPTGPAQLGVSASPDPGKQPGAFPVAFSWF